MATFQRVSKFQLLWIFSWLLFHNPPNLLLGNFGRGHGPLPTSVLGGFERRRQGPRNGNIALSLPPYPGVSNAASGSRSGSIARFSTT